MLRRFTCLTMLIALVGLNMPLLAQDAPAAEATDTDAPATEKPAEKAKPDPFKVPEGTDDKVLNIFLQRISRTPPEDRSREGILEHLGKMDKAIAEILTREVSEEMYISALELRLQLLGILPQLGDNSAVIKRSKLIDELKRDEREGVKALAARLELEEKISRLPVMKADAKKKLIEEIGEQLASTDTQEDQAFMQAAQNAMKVAQSLERFGDTENAVIAYKQYASILKKKNHPDLGDAVDRMDATVRRLELLGNNIEIAGPTVSGGKYNIDDLKGKVVLVDFWATWCGPCIAELPNVKNLYDAYHEKGFEVIGISLDQDEESLQEFIAENELKWPTIFFPEAENQGWDNPIARHYGISGIPTAILVNQDGKVVTLRARGEQLREELAKLLGPLEEEVTEEEEEVKDE